MDPNLSRLLGGTTAASETISANVGGLPGSISDHSHDKGHDDHNTLVLDVTLFLFLNMFIGQLFKQFSGWSGIPYTSMITIVGFVFGAFHSHMGRLDAAIVAWSQMDPHLILLIFLPALIFESAFNSDWHIFKHELWKVLIMAGPMLVIATGLTAVMMYYILGYQGEFTFTAALMLGAILSATDPVAVVALLKELGASRRLATLIEGESLLNDGTAMVIFLVLFDMVEGKETSAAEITGRFFRLSLGGIAVGILGGMIVSFLLSRIYNNAVLEVNTTIFSSYIIFWICEGTPLHVSGILAIVALGLYMTNTGKTRISAESEHAVHHVWSYIGFVAETLIFILSGIILGERFDSSQGRLTGVDFAKLIPAYIILHIIRTGITFLFWPCLGKVGYDMTWQQVLVVSYSGLRGAVGLSLALIVANSPKIPRYIQDVVILYVGGIALLTLLINATTTGILVEKLGLSKQSDLQKSIIWSLTSRLDTNIKENIEVLRNKRQFHHVEWEKLRDEVRMTDLRQKLRRWKALNIQSADDDYKEDAHALDNLGRLQQIKSKVEALRAAGQIEILSADDAGDENNHNLLSATMKKKNNSTLLSDAKNRAHMTAQGTFRAETGRKNKMKRMFTAMEKGENDQDKDSEGRFSVNPLGAQGSKVQTSITADEIRMELRHKFLTILKSAYWEFFEEGQMMSESVILLIESVDRSMDHEEQEMKDWEFIKAYIIDETYINFLQWLQPIPCIGAIAQRQLFHHFSLSYDIIVSLLEGHEQTKRMISAVISDKEFVGQILIESEKQVHGAEDYMHNNIEGMFPEICKAIQHRRAQHFLLHHELNFVHKMLKHGQIEEKEANQLKTEIDNKIYDLQLTEPTIELMDQRTRIMRSEELSNVFDLEDIREAFKDQVFEEMPYQPSTHITTKGSTKDTEKIFYIARGTVVESDGHLYEVDKLAPHIRFKRGNIACLQNLLPLTTDDVTQIVEQKSDLQTYRTREAYIIPLNLTHLRHILERDRRKLALFWSQLAPRYIIIHAAVLPQFRLLTQDKLQLFCKMCDIKLYNPGEVVDISNGGVILKGKLHKTSAKNLLEDTAGKDKSGTKFTTDEKNGSGGKLHEEHDQSAQKMTEGMKVQKSALKRKQTLKELGQLAKDNGLTGVDSSDDIIQAVSFIIPNPQATDYIASGTHQVVIMHFKSTLVATRILRGELSGEAVLNAWADSRRKHQTEDYHFHAPQFPSQVFGQNYNPRMTLQTRRKNQLGLTASQIGHSQQAKGLTQTLGSNKHAAHTIVPNRKKKGTLFAAPSFGYTEEDDIEASGRHAQPLQKTPTTVYAPSKLKHPNINLVNVDEEEDSIAVGSEFQESGAASERKLTDIKVEHQTVENGAARRFQKSQSLKKELNDEDDVQSESDFKDEVENGHKDLRR